MLDLILDEFLVNLAAIVEAILIRAPIANVKEPINFRRLQQLSFDVLSRHCSYFDLVEAFMEIPAEEANSLATVS